MFSESLDFFISRPKSRTKWPTWRFRMATNIWQRFFKSKGMYFKFFTGRIWYGVNEKLQTFSTENQYLISFGHFCCLNASRKIRQSIHNIRIALFNSIEFFTDCGKQAFLFLFLRISVDTFEKFSRRRRFFGGKDFRIFSQGIMN